VTCTSRAFDLLFNQGFIPTSSITLAFATITTTTAALINLQAQIARSAPSRDVGTQVI
jgi:hypothetical protein